MNSLILRALLLAVVAGRAVSTNLVANGDFASEQLHPGVPDFWQAAGNSAIRQRLTRDAGREGGYSARLDCSEFSGDGDDHHAMLCQVGKISVRGGQWYRLSFWAKAANLKAGAIELRLNDTRNWEAVGLSEAFTPGAQPRIGHALAGGLRSHESGRLRQLRGRSRPALPASRRVSNFERTNLYGLCAATKIWLRG